MIMAKERMINTRIWSDNWVSQLDPIEKLLFLYFLTNSYTNISGIYEVPLKVCAVETGIDPSMLEKILPRLEDKVIYRQGWVIIPHFPKYQNLNSKDVILGIKREFLSVPERIQDEATRGGWGDGLGIVPDTKPNLTKPTVGVPRIEYTQEDEKPKRKSNAKYPNARPLFKAVWGTGYPLDWNTNTTILIAGENLFIEHGVEDCQGAYKFYLANRHRDFFPEILDPLDLSRKWAKLEAFNSKL